VAQVLDELKYMPGFDQVNVINNVPEQKQIICDETRIKMVLSNLLSNSIKYRNATIDNCFVQIDMEEEGQFCKLSISDNGQGIGAEHQEKILRY
jgi:signal transduction histidine kinase